MSSSGEREDGQAEEQEPNYARVFRRRRVPEPEPPCRHLAGVVELPEPTTLECRACIEQGDTWVHLRMCLGCGEVGCCDSSPNRHASSHHGLTGHAVIRGIEPGERWVYCFEDDQTFTPQ